MTDNESVESKIIKTQDKNGEIYSFELIDVVEFNGREYGLLINVDEASESSDEDEEEEVVIMRLNKEDDNYKYYNAKFLIFNQKEYMV